MSLIMQHPIKPVAAKTGIEIKGWHRLRHALHDAAAPEQQQPKVVQAPLRHASYSITMNVYDEAMSEEKRTAHRGVIQRYELLCLPCGFSILGVLSLISSVEEP
jgi:hypothetical protein